MKVFVKKGALSPFFLKYSYLVIILHLYFAAIVPIIYIK
ncbi:hypothetical protein HCH_02161 [Hahella chejuensis KCTC 2396]|uniref:Uncharacterized protein n=1 Tax=Hahella chejuensis (strain KCTC 2396) TaxID=349521 RepID=Q2SK34_HAHCH|nr:hypothetical protein HCH_02161 [Hahella chejuensis KCTC 2396]